MSIINRFDIGKSITPIIMTQSRSRLTEITFPVDIFLES
jgi:hypothetical protein